MRSIAVLALLVVLLTGCAGATPWNAQNYAGITHVDVEFAPLFAQDGTVTGHYISRIRWWDGKEKQTLDLSADVGKGTLGYAVKGVAAFQAFTSRAEVERAVAQYAKEAGVEIVPKVVDVLIKALGLP